MYLRIACSLSLLVLLAGCAGINSRLDRFSMGNDKEVPLNFRQERATRDYLDAQNELGLAGVELSDRHKELIRARLTLNQIERDLRSESEKQQYYQYKPYLRGDRRRISFLTIPSLEARESWARGNGLVQRLTKNSPFEVSAIEQNDIFIGMSKRAVRESWGDPKTVEVAGSTTFNNERWKYSTYITTSEGFDQENRIVFFEGGRVVGWNKR